MYEYLFEIIMIIKDIPALNDNFLITFHQMNNGGKIIHFENSSTCSSFNRIKRVLINLKVFNSFINEV